MVLSGFLGTRSIRIGLISLVFLLVGCASRRLVPLPDGGLIDSEFQSSTKSEEGITVRVQASAWHGKPTDLEDYVTPLYVIIKNDTPSSLTIGYDDFRLLDENQTQYNPLPPETVVQAIEADYRRRYAFRPYFSFGFGYGRFHRFDPFFFDALFFDPFYPGWYYPPAYYPERLDDVITHALFPGTIQPKARLDGFIYFKRLPSRVKSATVEIGYRIQGEPGSRKLRFPFAIESRRY
jgi:hypothetical protein